MNPPFFFVRVNFCPHVVRCRVNVASVKAQATTNKGKAIGKLSASSRPSLKELLHVIVTIKLTDCVAAKIFLYSDSIGNVSSNRPSFLILANLARFAVDPCEEILFEPSSDFFQQKVGI